MAVVPELSNFFMAAAYNTNYKFSNLERSLKGMIAGNSIISVVNFLQSSYNKALKKSDRFHEPMGIKEIANRTKGFVSLGNQTGDGWLLPREIIELIESGCSNIVCMQPFGCLPNHIIGKGVIKGIKKKYPQANIVPIDYDASASSVNQLNRIKLMLSTAFKDLQGRTYVPSKQNKDNKNILKEIDLNNRYKMKGRIKKV